MFYEKLAELKEEKKREGLSGLQMGGVGLTGTAGAVGGAGAMIGAGKLNKRVGDFYSRGTKKDRDAAQRVTDNLNYNLRELRKDIDIVSGGDLNQLEAIDSWSLPWSLPDDEAVHALENLKWKIESSDEVINRDYSQLDPKTREALLADRPKRLEYDRKEIERQRAALVDKLKTFQSAAQDEADESFHVIKNRIKSRNRLVLGGSMLGGGLAAGYGAKKLFDRYNARKQRKD